MGEKIIHFQFSNSKFIHLNSEITSRNSVSLLGIDNCEEKSQNCEKKHQNYFKIKYHKPFFTFNPMTETSFHKSTYSLINLFTCTSCDHKPPPKNHELANVLLNFWKLKIWRVLADKNSLGTSATNSSDMIHVRSSHKHDHSDATQRQHFLNYNI